MRDTARYRVTCGAIGAVAIGIVMAIAMAMLPQALPSALAQDESAPLRVYVVAGQSNAKRTTALRVERALDTLLGQAERSESVVVLQYAVDGTSLERDWLAGGTATTEGDQSIYRGFQNYLTRTLSTLRRENPDREVEFAAVWWHQGESDVGRESSATNYGERLRTLIQDIRLTFQVPDLDFYIARLPAGNEQRYQYWPVLTEQQTQVGRDMVNAYTIELDDIANLVGGDRIHWTAAGYNELARRAAVSFSQATLANQPDCGTYFVHVARCSTADFAATCADDLARAVADASSLRVEPVTLSLVVDPDIANAQAAPGEPVDRSGRTLIYGVPVDPGSYDVLLQHGDVVVATGSVEVSECDFVVGDIDDSGEFDLGDVDAALRSLAGLETLAKLHRGDLDGDQSLALIDVLGLAQLLADQEPS